MFLKVDSTKPIFHQIAELIEDQILVDDLKIEDQVYSTNQLSQILAVNPATARKGLNLLIDEGILYKRRGIGMFVSSEAKHIIKGKRSRLFFEDFVKTMVNEARKLGLEKGEIIQMINQSEWSD